MAVLPVRTFAQVTAGFATAVQGRAAALIDFSVGSVLRAVSEAVAALSLWLQSLVVQVLLLTRAATSTAGDLDTWYADWGFTRLPARAATGLVTFGRFSTTGSGLVPLGTEVGTADGSLRYAVTADSGNAAYDPAQGAYVLGPGVGSLAVPVVAILGIAANASAWNVAAGLVTTVRSATTGIDTVTNAAPFATGVDAESDAAFRARFRLYIAGLSKATPAAITAAVADLQQGLQVQIVDNADPSGAATPGFVTVYVDDGSGALPDDLLTAAAAAVQAVVAGGVQAAVLRAGLLSATIAMTLEVAPGYDRPSVAATVTAALGTYVDALGVGRTLRYTRLAQIAYDASPGVTNVTAVLVNGGTLDLVPAPGRTIKAVAIAVS